MIEFIQTSPDLSPKSPYSLAFILKNTLIKTFWGCLGVIKHRELFVNCWVYSVSDFLPDLLPALLAKIIGKNVKWVAGYYQFAPQPWAKDNPYKNSLSEGLRGFGYWFCQVISYPLVKYFSDLVLVTSEPDVKRFKRTLAVRGGVELLPRIDNWTKDYDAVFVGRLHPQKGVLELIDIWRKVVELKPKAKLVIIGNGELEQEIRNRRIEYGLHHNIFIVGFADGALKNSFFMGSRLVLHPAVWDSGGMAAAEAMAFGLPCVGFNLLAYKTYYAKGMLKVDTIEEFATTICMLLDDKVLYDKYSREAREYVEQEFSWVKKVEEIWTILNNYAKQ